MTDKNEFPYADQEIKAYGNPARANPFELPTLGSRTTNTEILEYMNGPPEFPLQDMVPADY